MNTHVYDDNDIERDIQERGLTAPRITQASLDGKIASEQYHQFPGTTVTVCCLLLANGYTVIGESASVSPENFDAEIGRKVARAHARDKIWPLEGYLLRERLHQKEQA